MTVNPSEIDIRYFDSSDIDDYCDYFFRSPSGFIESIGLNPNVFSDEVGFRDSLTKTIRELDDRKQNPRLLVVLYRSEKIGFHVATHFIENESLIMHAHFIKSDYRRKGIGTISYVKAIEKFLNDFNLKEIIFKTPVRNAAPMRIKEKLGLQSVGEETLDWPSFLPGTRASVFRVDRDELARIKNRIGL